MHPAIKTPNEPRESCVETGCSPTFVKGSHKQGQTFSKVGPNQVLDKAPFKENANKSCFMHLLKILFNLIILSFWNLEFWQNSITDLCYGITGYWWSKHVARNISNSLNLRLVFPHMYSNVWKCAPSLALFLYAFTIHGDKRKENLICGLSLRYFLNYLQSPQEYKNLFTEDEQSTFVFPSKLTPPFVFLLWFKYI